MDTDERLLNVILNELTALKTAHKDFQDEVRREFQLLRDQLHKQDLVIDRLKSKMAMIATAAGIVTAAVLQWLVQWLHP